ncbi:alpha/beta hydrolase [Microbacterium sp. UFMG61]|uniref:alpha/beta hydrolase n=1 Tax=Microbacterium sp. UFMG61 TaxID=2745935 RepID=UPI00188E6F27|nr:lysophospholipase [Microbacterium sp. UFMG61]
MTTTSSPALWTPPARVRGTLAVITGRGERAGVYERFGRRLSSDGYVVAVFDDDADAASAWLAEATETPRVLVGSDAGASAVLRLVTQGASVEAAVVAGTLVDAELDLPPAEERTACPLHLNVLATEATSIEVAPAEPLPAPADLAAIEVPVLAIHGGADTVSPLPHVIDALRAVPDLEIVETVDGLHDALNDQSHRSVAAALVQWLERLRGGDVHAPVVRTHETAAVATA